LRQQVRAESVIQQVLTLGKLMERVGGGPWHSNGGEEE
jgi:hypothetical protein